MLIFTARIFIIHIFEEKEIQSMSVRTKMSKVCNMVIYNNFE